MSRPSPGRPCEKKPCLVPARPALRKRKHVSSRARPALRKKKHVSSRARPALRKKKHVSSGPSRPAKKETCLVPWLGWAWAGLGWAGLAPQIIKKALGFPVRRTWGIPRAQTLIKPVVYGDFWGPFCKMALESMNTALGFSLKVDDVPRLCKTLETVSKTMFRSIQKSCSEFLIKPVVY